MATNASSDSTVAPPCSSMFSNNQLIQSFPPHVTVKLDDNSFVQWRQQIRLITDGYNLTGFLDGTITAPPRFVQSPDGSLMANPEALAYNQQDKLLTSWLLSTISPSVLPSFTDAKTANDVWITATRLFAPVSGAKLSRIRHDLYSIKKGAMSVKDYIAKIQNMCALIDAAGSRISDTEKVGIVLAGLPSEFDTVRAVQEVPVHAHFVEAFSTPAVVDSGRGGRPSVSRVRAFRSCAQCQICGRFGHLAQLCYYRFNREYGGPESGVRASTRSVDNGSGAAVVDGSVPYGGSVKVSGDAFPFMTSQPNPWWDGSLSGAAPYLQFSVPQCFEGCDNKAGTGGVFGSVGPGARSVGRVAGYAAVGPSIGQGVRHSAGSAGYGAVVGDEFTKPMGFCSTYYVITKFRVNKRYWICKVSCYYYQFSEAYVYDIEYQVEKENLKERIEITESCIKGEAGISEADKSKEEKVFIIESYLDGESGVTEVEKSKEKILVTESCAGDESELRKLNLNQEPYEGMLFESMQAAKAFYDEYAKRMEGFNQNRQKSTRVRVRKRESRREGCMARMKVKREKPGKYVITKFVKKHNHPLFVTSGKDQPYTVRNRPKPAKKPGTRKLNPVKNWEKKEKEERKRQEEKALGKRPVEEEEAEESPSPPKQVSKSLMIQKEKHSYNNPLTNFLKGYNQEMLPKISVSQEPKESPVEISSSSESSNFQDD
ncbi:hypothetical protein Goklo_015302 [Gossypium klotzschianum]|uniref:FAR1 domain-containing protein n=1 Tax=Gossypium klotzschianum TaxID=34286 RepID=A0A7J8UAH1_9ROSI|nr:hypothetical protein [Gossypium klotzschianum]